MSNLDSDKSFLLKPLRLRLSFRTDFIIFPIDYGDLRDSLVKHGYVPIAPPPTTQAVGVRLGAIGQIARKGDNSITFDPDRQIIGVDGVLTTEVIQVFDDLEQILIEELKIDLPNSVRFFETLSEYRLITNKNPRNVFDKFPMMTDILDRISTVIGVDVSPFGFRVGSRGVVPNQEEWMDIRIEPVVVRADSEYYIYPVYRSRDKEKVKKFLVSLEDILLKIVGILEEGA